MTTYPERSPLDGAAPAVEGLYGLLATALAALLLMLLAVLLFADLAGAFGARSELLDSLQRLLSEQPGAETPALLIGLTLLPIPLAALVLGAAAASEYRLRSIPRVLSRSGRPSRPRNRSLATLSAALGLGLVFTLFGSVMVLAGLGRSGVDIAEGGVRSQSVLAFFGSLLVLLAVLLSAAFVGRWWHSGRRRRRRA